MTEAGHDIAIAGEIYGGQDFESHYNRETTRAEIEQGSAEVVVLQGNSYEPIYDQEDFHTYGGLLAEEVYAADKKPPYFMTWHHQDSPAEINTIQPQCEALGIDQASPVVPVALAVKEIVENHPDIHIVVGCLRHRRTPSVAGHPSSPPLSRMSWRGVRSRPHWIRLMRGRTRTRRQAIAQPVSALARNARQSAMIRVSWGKARSGSV